MENVENTFDGDGEHNDKNIPLKLCFKPKVLLGRSYVHIGLPIKIPILISPKFYSKNQEEHVDSEKIERIKRSLETVSPNEQFEKPLTENQKYGWYNVKFSNLTPSDPNLDFRFKRNQFVFEHLMNYAKIRE